MGKEGNVPTFDNGQSIFYPYFKIVAICSYNVNKCM